MKLAQLTRNWEHAMREQTKATSY